MFTDATNLKLRRGDTFSLSVVLNNVNLTGATVRMMARARYTDASPVISLATGGSGIVVTGGTNSTIAVTMLPGATVLLEAPLNLVYDMEYTLAGYTETILRGELDVEEDATR